MVCRLEAPPPRNYNPADYFIQLLAIVPDKEEACKKSNNMICDKFERSEMGVKIAIESTAVVKILTKLINKIQCNNFLRQTLELGTICG